MKRMLSILAIVLSLFLLVSCPDKNEENGTGNLDDKRVVETNNIYINVAETSKVVFEGFEALDATFKSENDEVVIIDELGKYLGINPGMSKIVITHEDKSWSFFVIVEGERIKIEGLRKNIEITISETFKINYTTNDPNGVKFASLNEELLTVDESGLIKPLMSGKTQVVVTSKTNPNIKETINVHILELSEIDYEINLEKEVITLNFYETKKIEVTTDDPNGVRFVSFNQEVLTVDENGIIKPLAEGEAQVRISSKTNPKVSKEITVIVTDDRSIEEKNLMDAINNTVNLDNYTLEINVSENIDNLNYYYDIFLMFDNNLTKLKASHIEEYYELIDDRKYAYIQTEEGFIKEEIHYNPEEGFLFYENFTMDDFTYSKQTDKYSLKTDEPHYKLLDDFIDLFGEDGAIIFFELTLSEGFINKMSFVLAFDEYAFSVEISVININETVVEVPENV